MTDLSRQLANWILRATVRADTLAARADGDDTPALLAEGAGLAKVAVQNDGWLESNLAQLNYGNNVNLELAGKNRDLEYQLSSARLERKNAVDTLGSKERVLAAALDYQARLETEVARLGDRVAELEREQPKKPDREDKNAQ